MFENGFDALIFLYMVALNDEFHVWTVAADESDCLWFDVNTLGQNNLDQSQSV